MSGFVCEINIFLLNLSVHFENICLICICKWYRKRSQTLCCFYYCGGHILWGKWACMVLFAGQINLASNYHVYLFHYASRWYLLFIVAVGGKWACRLWAGADWMNPWCGSLLLGESGTHLTKGLWAYSPNLVQNHVDVTLTIMIRSGDKFARVTATELSCHVQICDLMGLLQS